MKAIIQHRQSFLVRYSASPTVQALAALAVSMLNDVAPDIETRGLASGVAAGGAFLIVKAAEIRRNRIVEALDECMKRGLHLTEEELQSNENLHIFWKTMQVVINTERGEKIRAIARMYCNYQPKLGSPKATDEYEEMLRIVDDMSLREMEALHVLRNYELSPDGEGLEPRDHAAYFWDEFLKSLENIGVDQAQSTAFLQRLTRTGFYQMFMGYLDVGNTGQTTSSLDEFIALVQIVDPNTMTETK